MLYFVHFIGTYYMLLGYISLIFMVSLSPIHERVCIHFKSIIKCVKSIYKMCDCTIKEFFIFIYSLYTCVYLHVYTSITTVITLSMYQYIVCYK